MRSAIAINADKIADFREANGRLPDSLDEFGAAYPDVTSYTRLPGNLYELRVSERGDTIVYRSDQNLGELLQGAGATLEQSRDFREGGGPCPAPPGTPEPPTGISPRPAATASPWWSWSSWSRS